MQHSMWHVCPVLQVGFNMRKVTKGGVTIKMWDLGGQVNAYGISNKATVTNTMQQATDYLHSCVLIRVGHQEDQHSRLICISAASTRETSLYEPCVHATQLGSSMLQASLVITLQSVSVCSPVSAAYGSGIAEGYKL